MVRLRYSLVIWGLFSAFIAIGQQLPIVLDVEESPLAAVLEEVEKNNGLLFSFSESDIKAIYISGRFNEYSISDFLDKLLAQTSLEFELVDKKFVILTQRTSDESSTKIPPENLQILCGRVLDSLCTTPLAFANVIIKNTTRGTYCDEEGYFEFKAPVNATDTLVLSYSGYQEKAIPANTFVSPSCPTVALNNYEFSACVVITEYMTNGIKINEDGAYIDLQPNRLSALPGQAEPDVLNTIKFLPGISSPDGSASNICIRGGTPDQNLILWEDIPVYHAAHYFGMISALNPYIMNSVKVYRGGFGADYGGRISGLIDLKSEDALNQLSNFGVGINFINGYANGKLNFLDNAVSVVYSLRHSLTGLWQSPTFESITRRIHQGVLLQLVRVGELPSSIRINEEFKFFDSNIKANIRLSAKDKLSIAWLYGNNDFDSVINEDRAKRQQSDSLYLTNSGSKISWSHQWRPNFSSTLSALSSNYAYDYNYEVKTQGQNTIDKSGIKNSRIKEQQIHLKNSISWKNDYQLSFGYHFTQYDVGYEILKQSQENNQSNIRRQLISNTQVGYATLKLPLTGKSGMEAGLRTSYFENEDQLYWEPRLRVWHQASANLNLYLNAGRYHQFLSQLIQIQGDDSSIETPVWSLSGKKEIPVLSANQFQVGGIYAKNDWTIDLQAYLKNIDGLTSLATGFDDQLADNFKLGSAKIRGIDVLLKKRWKKYRTWISYSLSKVDYAFNNFFDPAFPASIDQPHAFHWVHLWKKKSWEFSLGWKGTSGTPYSNIDNFKVKLNPPGQGPRESIQPIVPSYNSERLPLQHQMDVSVLYNFLPKKRGNWKGTVGLSIFNVYNQINQYQRSFLLDKVPNEPIRLLYTNKVDVGITPNVVFRMEWY